MIHLFKGDKMKVALFISMLTISIYHLQAEEATKYESTNQEIKSVNNENLLKKVEVMSLNGAVTRADCPYTCEMRSLPKEHCKTWVATSDPSLCYVWDTRLPQKAVRVGN